MKIAVALCSAIAGLLLVEVLARAVAPAYNPSGHVALMRLPDGTAVGPPNVTRRQVKNTGDYDVLVRFNASGFRDAKPIGTSTADSIFVVGDSFGFGWGVDEGRRFSNVLEDRIGRPVFNISEPGTDFDGYDRLIHYAEANGAHIGTLVVSACMENDLREYGSDADDPEQWDLAPVAGAKAYLTEHSAVYLLVTAVIHRTPWLEHAAARTGLLVPNLAAIAESDSYEKALISSAARLRRLVAGRRAVILIVPSRALWAGTDAHRRQVARTHERFVGLLRQAGLTVVDVRERFERTGNPLGLHFVSDGHWTAAGHTIAADALLEQFSGSAARASAPDSVSTSGRVPAR